MKSMRKDKSSFNKLPSLDLANRATNSDYNSPELSTTALRVTSYTQLVLREKSSANLSADS
jgi:hypothetical protein